MKANNINMFDALKIVKQPQTLFYKDVGKYKHMTLQLKFKSSLRERYLKIVLQVGDRVLCNDDQRLLVLFEKSNIEKGKLNIIKKILINRHECSKDIFFRIENVTKNYNKIPFNIKVELEGETVITDGIVVKSKINNTTNKNRKKRKKKSNVEIIDYKSESKKVKFENNFLSMNKDYEIIMSKLDLISEDLKLIKYKLNNNQKLYSTTSFFDQL